ncbi:hypothetical protein DSECCO2_599680 [anaerobic digester metagenome]
MRSRAIAPHFFHMATAAPGSMPCADKNAITARIPNSRAYSCPMLSAFCGEIPRTCESCAGSFSMISSVLSPNLATMREAVTGPIPLIAPPER